MLFLLPNSFLAILMLISQKPVQRRGSGEKCVYFATQEPTRGGGGGTWVFFRWVSAARDSKLAPLSRKNFP